MIFRNDALGIYQRPNPQLPNLELQAEALEWYDTPRIQMGTHGRHSGFRWLKSKVLCYQALRDRTLDQCLRFSALTSGPYITESTSTETEIISMCRSTRTQPLTVKAGVFLPKMFF